MMQKPSLLASAFLQTSLIFLSLSAAFAQPTGVRKIKDVIVFKDTLFHSAFPSVVKTKKGEIILAFRRAPNRLLFGEKHNNHTDPNSYLVSVRSRDGETWTKDPALLYAHPFGGSQDPCLLQLRDGSLLCATYGWALIRPDGIPNLKRPVFDHPSGFVFLGGYLVRSENGGKTWQGPTYPPHIEPEINYTPYGQPVPAYNRGALYEGKDGQVFWIVAASDTKDTRKTSTHLLISNDKGKSWQYSCPVAVDDKASFNETSVYETPKGDLIAFLRTAGLDDQACIARSTDGGKSFGAWEKMGFQGHPLHALRLPDNRVLITYGYRHAPLGVRARILNAECTDFATASEIILRTDGGSTDLGYPWSVQLDKKRVLVSYYFNQAGGPVHIAGTILEID